MGEIAREVVNPEVYKLASRSCVEDLLVMYGGFFANTDRSWTVEY
jgi:hypothetical protein